MAAKAPRKNATDRASQRKAMHSNLRVFEIFKAIRRAGRPMTLSEIALATGIPVSTCHGVLKALENAGYFYELNGRSMYPTRKLWELAEAIRLRDPVIEQLIPRLRALRDETDETVIVGTRQGDQVQYLLIFESSQAIRYSANVGEHKPLHSSAIGKVMLALLDEQQRATLLNRNTLRKVTPNTLTKKAALVKDIEAGADRGYWVTRGENVEDVMAIATSLQLESLELGVAIAGPIQRIDRAEQRLSRLLIAAVNELESFLEH